MRTYRNISSEDRNALPTTFGATPHANSRYISDLDPQDHKTTLEFLEEGFRIGLENYIDSASWRICDILKATNNANKEAQVFQLCLAAVAAWDQKRALKAWHQLTKVDKVRAQAMCEDYLEHCLDYLIEGWGLEISTD